jgi:Tol biopolymer transport system component
MKRLRSMLVPVIAAALVAGAGAAQHARAAFPGSNGKIVFASNRDAFSNFEIYSMNADGSGVTRLTNNAASDFEPAWSPDGSKIAFASARSGNLDIYVMNADGSGVTQLTTDAANDFEPAWSPDGTKIAFTSARNNGRLDNNGRYDVFVMSADGSNQTDLTKTSGTNEFQAAWSPDGSTIAFVGDASGGIENVFVMNASDGSGRTNLTNYTGDGMAAFDPNWSPDGSKIAFDGNIDNGFFNAIWVMDANGSNPTRLTGPTSGPGDSEPAWSPDGTKIAFVREMNANGSGEGNVTNNASPTSAQNPDWGIPSAAVPTDASQCKNNGWRTRVRADGTAFKNQGDCIQYVKTGK